MKSEQEEMKKRPSEGGLEPQKAVPFFIYETEVARNERTTRRLMAALIIAAALLFATNALWFSVWL